MSEYYKIDVTLPVQEFVKEVEQVPLGAIMILHKPNEVNLSAGHMYDYIFHDEKIGFWFADVRFEIDGETLVIHLDSDKLSDVPVFMRNTQQLQLDPENIRLSCMQSMLKQGYYYRHIAKPLFLIKK